MLYGCLVKIGGIMNSLKFQDIAQTLVGFSRRVQVGYKFIFNSKGTRRAQTSTADNSHLFYEIQICNLSHFMSGFISNGGMLFLHWLGFVTI